jgi:uncharacterized membrane protein YphA (DoxX/SURF4 family)
VGLLLNSLFSLSIGIRLYGAAAIAFGVVGLVWGDFAVMWTPDPDGVPGLSVWGYVVALAPLLAGAALQFKATIARGALVLTVLYALGVLLLDVPRVFAKPAEFVTWYGVAEQLALAAAGMIAYATSATLAPSTAERLVTIGRQVFGGCLLVFGLAHLFYLAYTAELVPRWLPPSQIFWVYATAAGHFAAGLAILTGIRARMAAILLTAMFIVFGILVHAPSVIREPHTHFNWAENAINFALIASAWIVAASIRAKRPRMAP